MTEDSIFYDRVSWRYLLLHSLVHYQAPARWKRPASSIDSINSVRSSRIIGNKQMSRDPVLKRTAARPEGRLLFLVVVLVVVGKLAFLAFEAIEPLTFAWAGSRCSSEKLGDGLGTFKSRPAYTCIYLHQLASHIILHPITSHIILLHPITLAEGN